MEVVNDNQSLVTFLLTTIIGIFVRHWELRKINKK